MAGQEPAEPASLLGMPPGIRNRIYREVLVDYDEHISFYHEEFDYPESIHKENTIQPGILRTCTQIRKEALSIFLQENHFTTWIQEGKLEPHLEHWFWQTKERSIPVLGDIKWKNLKVWLRAYWSGRLSESTFHKVFNFDDWPIFTVCLNALEMVRHLEGTKWDVVEAVLEEFAKAVEVIAEGPSFFFD